MRDVQALLLDFNGTLSDDEPVLFGVLAEMFARHGRPLSERDYLDQLAGLSDAEVFRRWLGPAVDVDALTAERVRRYSAAVADGSTVSAARREAVRLAAAHVPVVMVTGAWRAELTAVLRACGLDGAIRATVCADDVVRQKPDPEPYRLACATLGIAAEHAVAIEDTEAGVASARGAGVRCAAVTTTMAASRLAAADLLLPGLTAETVARLLEI